MVGDELWVRIESLLPVRQRRHRHPGRKALDDRKVLCGSLFVLCTGIRGEWLPAGAGFGSGMTCWRRLRDWNNAGVWQRLHEVLLAEPRAADRLDMSGAVIDSSHVRALKGGPKPAGARSTGLRPGSKHHLICDATGIPLAVTLTGGNRNDITQPMPLPKAVPPIRGKRGRPRQRPRELYADRGHDHDCHRRQVWAKGIKPVIARRGTEHGSGLGTKRWAVEQTIALPHWFGRPRIRWEIRDDIHEAFLKLACSLICWRHLRATLC
ncbi:IS5 family transposase [Streptomyces sp. enrichment culture]|uniref:IS5 family transposase n=1 Tax=Streptomyces sp. enrichment culture TaxID=1795815 RepID=UPI003F54E684